MDVNFKKGASCGCQHKYQDDDLEEIVREAFLNDIFKLIHHANESIFDLRASKIRNQAREIKSLISLSIKEIEAANKFDGKLRGVPSGFIELDKITSGWKKGELIVVAARPGMGKTAFANSLALNAAYEGFPVAIFSLEISAIQLTLRLISSEAEIVGEKLKKGNLREEEWNDLNRKIKNLEEAPLFIDDTYALSILELSEKCHQLVDEHKIQLIVVDHLQQMLTRNDPENNRRDFSKISIALKALAEKLDIPIIIMSQVSRAPETRGGLKKPMLSDLNEFGAIQLEADRVLFIYRPEYYDIMEDEEGESLRGIAEIIIAKNRFGSLDSVFLKFIGRYMKFVDHSPFEASCLPTVSNYDPYIDIVNEDL